MIRTKVTMLSHNSTFETLQISLICSASKVEFKAPHNLYLMMAMLLACSNCYTEITLFVSNEDAVH